MDDLFGFLSDEPAGRGPAPPLTVSDLTARLKAVVEGTMTFALGPRSEAGTLPSG